MKRFFATVGFSFIFSLLVLNRFLSSYAFIYIAVSTVLFVLSLISGRIMRKNKFLKELSCILFAFIISALSFVAVSELIYKPQIKLANEMCSIRATVIDCPTVSSGGNYGYLIKTKTVNGESRGVRMMLYSPYDICAEPYDEVEFTVKPFLLGGNENSVHEHFKSKRTYLGAYTRYASVHEPDKKPFIAFFYMRRLKSEKNIRKYLQGDYAEFAVSILFGDKIYLSQEIKDIFSAAGLSHILAISGLHTSVWIMGLYYILKKLRFDDRVSGAVCIVACICLVIFCAFSVSVIRASVMLSLYFGASFFGKKGDSLNSLGLAAFLICLFNPYAVCDVSFLLSFFATLGIISFSMCFPALLKRDGSEKIHSIVFRYALGVACVSFSAGLFTAPVILHYFSSVNFVAVAGNICVSFLLPFCLILSGILSVCSGFGFIARTVAALLYATEKYIFFAITCISSLPFAVMLSDSATFKSVFSVFLVIAATVIYAVRRKEFSLTALLTALSVVVVTFS